MLGDYSKHLKIWKNNYLCRLSEDMEAKCFMNILDFYEKNVSS